MNRGIRKKWVVRRASPSVVDRLRTKLDISPLLARLLANRGIEDPDAAEAFLDARLSKHMRSPMLFREMHSAADRVLKALVGGERIGIYGDYDVDGATGSAILVSFFRELGADPFLYIPSRVKDGYGLQEGGIRRMAEAGVRLLVAVDCGAASGAEIAFAAHLGMDVIVCDHHEPHGGARPPALAVLNPVASDSGFPFSGLCGAGVAFYLALGVRMLLRERTGNRGPDLRRLLDLVALGTVADIMPLLEENRVFVKYGLEKLNRSERPGIVALKQVSGVTDVNAGTISFRLAPRLNACGRLGEAVQAVELLLTEDSGCADRLAEEVDGENRKRQEVEAKILTQAMEMVEKGGGVENRRSIVLASADWHPGVVGIVASRLVERFYRPTVLIALDSEKGEGRGSARSIAGLDLLGAITACGDLLEGFGGHRVAAGVKIRSGKVGAFASRFEETVRGRTTPENFVPETRFDEELSFACVDEACIEEIARLEPTGPANPRPVFMSRAVTVRSSRVVGNGHLKLSLEQDGWTLSGIAFGMGGRQPAAGEPIDILHTPMISEWKGTRTLELRIHDIRPSGSVS